MSKESTIEKTSLPVGWEMKKLLEVSTVLTGKHNANHSKNDGKYRFYTCAYDHLFCDTKSFKGECLVLPGNGVNVGEVFYFDGEFDAYQRTYVIFDIKINARYLHYHMLLYWRELGTKLQYGSATNFIKIGNFQDYKVSLAPVPQQKQIVATLDKAFAAIDTAKANAEQNLKNAKELFESYLQNVFENKGDNWEDKSIGEIGKPSMCKRILKEQTSSLGDIPFYKIGTFGKSPNAFITEELFQEYKTKYSFPKKGDILISASGTIGRRVAYDGLPAFFQDSNIVWIDNDESQVLNDYLYMFYGYCDWQPSTGATISRLYNANLKRIRIAFPNALDEQEKIVQKLNTLSIETKKLEAIYTQKIADLEELKKSVLQKAFSGQLNTVT